MEASGILSTAMEKYSEYNELKTKKRRKAKEPEGKDAVE
jgi:hypothetical protein